MERPEYYSVKALSNTAMGYLKKSPLHFRAFMDGKIPSSKAMEIGRWVHEAVLEPEQWNGKWFVKENARTKAGKEYNESLEAKGLVGITQNEYDMIRGMVGRLLQCEWLGRLFVLYETMIEQEFYWQEQVNGQAIDCKAKLDLIIPGANMMIDLKTTREAEPKGFIRKARYSYDYDRQMAWYKNACVKAGILNEDAKCFFVCIEKEPPYAYSIIEVAPSAIKSGERKYQKLLEQYAALMQTRDFHTYPSEVWEEEETHDQPIYSLEDGGMSQQQMLEMFAKVGRGEVLTVGKTLSNGLRVKSLKTA